MKCFLSDNHDSHLATDVIKLMREAEVVLLPAPSTTAIKSQTATIGWLNITVFRALKTYYYAALDNWLKNHPGQIFGIYNIPNVRIEAYTRAFIQH